MSETLVHDASDMRGITWNKKRARYRVQLRIKGRVANFGEYLLLAEALEVRDLVRSIIYGKPLPEGIDEDALNGVFEPLISKVYEYLDQDPATQAKAAEDREVRTGNPVVKDLIAKVEDLDMKLSLAAGKLHAHEQVLQKAGLL